MAEEHQVRIRSWPRESAGLKHSFSQKQAVPVSASFEDIPALVTLSTLQERPLAVSMNMLLSAVEEWPLCLSLCEPVCAESEYTLQIQIFDRPVITIRIEGLTNIFATHEEL